MSDFEIFGGGLEGSGQMDEAAYERFVEQMKENAAQVKALQKGEQKQKKNEGKLIKILLKFLQTSQNSDLVLLITRALEKNVPAGFVLSIILLGNDDIQEEVGVKLALEAPDEMSAFSGNNGTENTLYEPTLQSEEGLNPLQHERRRIVEFSDIQKVLPLAIRIQIDLWGKNIMETASGIPHKILKTVKVHEDGVKSKDEDEREGPAQSEMPSEIHVEPIIIRLTAHVLHEFIQKNGIESDITAIKGFAEFIVKGILKQVEEQISNQKEIKEPL